jgi:Tfp pilus assembly protein PilF
VSDHAAQPFRYRAFISYSHRDERWASWLHKALERYRVPRRVVGRQTSAGVAPARIAPVFRDREELPTATDLSRVVNAALEQSAAMIVICSPAAAASRWVNEEIRAFRRLGRGDRIYCLIVGGAPEAVGAEHCFPAALGEALTADEDLPALAEPIGADVRPGKDRPRAALLKLVAGLIGVGLDELARRDLQRRNRRLVAISVASVVGMSIASVLAAVAVIARNEAERQRVRAETEAATAQQTSEFLVQLFQVVDPGEARGATVTAREILDRGAARIDRDLAAQPVVRANLLQTMGRVYTGLGLYDPAIDLLERASELRADLAQAPTNEAIATANALGAALFLKGEYEEAEPVYADALSAALQLHPEGDAQVTEAMAGLAELSSQHGDFAAAEARYREALEIDRRLHGESHPDVARTLAGLASALLYQDKFDEGEAAFRKALVVRRETLGEDHPLVAETLNNLAWSLYFAGRPAEADPFFREALARYRVILGDDHPFVSSILNNLGRLSLERGELDDAESVLSEALAIDRQSKDPDHEDFIFTLNNLGLVQIGLGKVEQALPLLEEARRVADKLSHRLRAQVWSNLADAYWRLGRIADAFAAVDQARPLLAGEDYRDELWYLANLDSIEGAIRVASGELDAGGPLLAESYPIVVERWGENGLFARLAAARLARFYEASGEAELARRYRQAAQ